MIFRIYKNSINHIVTKISCSKNFFSVYDNINISLFCTFNNFLRGIISNKIVNNTFRIISTVYFN